MLTRIKNKLLDQYIKFEYALQARHMEFAKENNLFCCKLCGKEASHDYMLKNDLWDKHFKKTDLVHLECFEKHIGRLLSINDFTDAPINNSIKWILSR